MSEIIKISILDRGGMARLARLAERLAAPGELLTRIAGHMMDAVEENFSTGGRGRWPALARSTVRARAKRGRGATPILIDTTQLEHSVQPSTTGHSAIVGTNKAYAAIHQFGGQIQHSGSVQLRVTRGGALVRQKGFRNLAVFAKSSHKLKTGRSVNYTINIPARPFLKLEPSDMAKIEGEIGQFFTGK